LHRVLLLLGLLAVCAAIVVFGWAVLFSYTRPILFYKVG